MYRWRNWKFLLQFCFVLFHYWINTFLVSQAVFFCLLFVLLMLIVSFWWGCDCGFSVWAMLASRIVLELALPVALLAPPLLFFLDFFDLDEPSTTISMNGFYQEKNLEENKKEDNNFSSKWVKKVLRGGSLRAFLWLVFVSKVKSKQGE